MNSRKSEGSVSARERWPTKAAQRGAAGAFVLEIDHASLRDHRQDTPQIEEAEEHGHSTDLACVIGKEETARRYPVVVIRLPVRQRFSRLGPGYDRNERRNIPSLRVRRNR
jgi:hypothetical protein